LLGAFSCFASRADESQLLQIPRHLRPGLRKLGFDGVDLLLHGGDVDLLFLLEGVHVAGDVEVEVVLVADLGDGGAVGVLLDIRERAEGGDDLVEVGLAQAGLVLRVLELAAGVDEENIRRLLALVEDQDGGGDAGAEEEIGGQADDAFEEVFLDQAADRAFGPPRKRTPWGTMTPTRPSPSRAVSIMWRMKA
jgi:hypothetical protein